MRVDKKLFLFDVVSWMERADYLFFRSQYHPSPLKLVIVAESPPLSGKYFYNREGTVSEPLFSALMQQIDVKLRDDLKSLNPDQSAAIVLIKMNVCRLLEDRLSRDGFEVINRGQEIPFPSSGQQAKFRAKFSEVVRRAGL